MFIWHFTILELVMSVGLMAAYSKLCEFQLNTESIDAYLECVDMFYKTNSITEYKQITVFLSVIRG